MRESRCVEVKVLELTMDLDRFKSQMRYNNLCLVCELSMYCCVVVPEFLPLICGKGGGVIFIVQDEANAYPGRRGILEPQGLSTRARMGPTLGCNS